MGGVGRTRARAECLAGAGTSGGLLAGWLVLAWEMEEKMNPLCQWPWSVVSHFVFLIIGYVRAVIAVAVGGGRRK